MNRIKLGPLAGLAKSPTDFHELSFDQQDSGASFEDLTDENDDLAEHLGMLDGIDVAASRTQGSVFLPVHYESSYAYPLLIFVHN